MPLHKLHAPLANSNPKEVENFEPFAFPDLWELEKHDTFSRLRIGPAKDQIRLMLNLCKDWNSPFWLLIVVVASRDEWKTGRYQYPRPICYSEVETLLWEHHELFEQDGRAHLWLRSAETGNMLIMDNHNLIYGYGDLNVMQSALISKGYRQGSVTIPYPHAHNYHPEFDEDFHSLIGGYDWIHSELRPEDDD